MALTHLLDTSVYCQPLRKVPVASVITRWKRLGDEALCVSVLCEAEVLQGLEAKGSEELRERYRQLLEGRLPVVDIDLDVARTYATASGALIRQGQPRPVMDLLIASTAKAAGLVLATLNAKDVRDVEGLAVEDWSIEP